MCDTIRKRSKACSIPFFELDVDLFMRGYIASKIGLQYEKDDANRDVLLQYLSDNGLSLTAENLATGFGACKSKLKLSQKIQQHNGTTVVDFGERVQNPSKITSELKQTIRRKIARYDSSEYPD